MNSFNRTDLDFPEVDRQEAAHKAIRPLVTHIRQIEDDQILRLHFEGDDKPIEMPAFALRKLKDILIEIAKGNSVTILPIHAELTTQEAADILNVSRPYFVKLLKEEKIPFHMAGTHRRIYTADLKKYMNERDQEREGFLDELARLAQEDDLGY